MTSCDISRSAEEKRGEKKKIPILLCLLHSSRWQLFWSYDLLCPTIAPHGGVNSDSISIAPPLYREDGADSPQEGTAHRWRPETARVISYDNILLVLTERLSPQRDPCNSNYPFSQTAKYRVGRGHYWKGIVPDHFSLFRHRECETYGTVPRY